MFQLLFIVVALAVVTVTQGFVINPLPCVCVSGSVHRRGAGRGHSDPGVRHQSPVRRIRLRRVRFRRTVVSMLRLLRASVLSKL